MACRNVDRQVAHLATSVGSKRRRGSRGCGRQPACPQHSELLKDACYVAKSFLRLGRHRWQTNARHEQRFRSLTLASLDRLPQHCTRPKVQVPSCSQTACLNACVIHRAISSAHITYSQGSCTAEGGSQMAKKKVQLTETVPEYCSAMTSGLVGM